MSIVLYFTTDHEKIKGKGQEKKIEGNQILNAVQNELKEEESFK